MSDLPLSSVENTVESTSNLMERKIISSAGSPYKMSTTEKRVIGGLQQLTQLLFNNHFKPVNASAPNNNKENTSFIQSEEITSTNERPSSSCDSTHHTDQDNKGNLAMILDDAHVGSEKFCAMVVRQIAHLDEYDDWHNTQLNAYDKASGAFFVED